MTQARGRAHEQLPVDELVPAAVIGHSLQVGDRNGLLATDPVLVMVFLQRVSCQPSHLRPAVWLGNLRLWTTPVAG